MNELAQRKRMLIAESELHRLTLCADLRRATRPLRWVDVAQPAARPLVLLAIPLAGVVLTRRWSALPKWASRAWAVAGIVRSLPKLPSALARLLHHK